jgi:hypothetical protein
MGGALRNFVPFTLTYGKFLVEEAYLINSLFLLITLAWNDVKREIKEENMDLSAVTLIVATKNKLTDYPATEAKNKFCHAHAIAKKYYDEDNDIELPPTDVSEVYLI